MIFINEADLPNLLNILNGKTTDNMNPDLKNKLSQIFLQFFKENYITQPSFITNFLNYNTDDEYNDIKFEQYGISSTYYSKINKLIKRTLVYYLEYLMQIKGSLKTLEVFSNLFLNIFGPMNIYQVIVTKRKKIIDGEVKYVLTYDLKPLIITNYDILLTTFDDKISLTKKHLMTLEQYADFNVFPAKTNLIYLQFSKSNNLVNNLKIFEPMLTAYAMTVLNTKIFQIKNFLNLPTFNLVGSDVLWILKYAEYSRLRLKQTDEDIKFDFNAKFKAGISYIFPSDSIDTLESFLYEYLNLDYKDRRALDALKRKWRLFQTQNIKISQFENFNDMEIKLSNAYPELINLIKSFTTDEEFLDFYFEFYNLILINVGKDMYLNYFITFIFMNVLTGSIFVDKVFLPVYNIFQKYFFPAELSFLEEIENSIFIKDKFEALATTYDVHSLISHSKLDKYRMLPERIFVNFYTKNSSIVLQNDYTKLYNTSFIKENLEIKNIIKTQLIHNFSESKNLDDNIFIFTDSKKLENIKIISENYLSILSKNQENLEYSEDKHINVSSNIKENLNEIVITKNKVDVNTNLNDDYHLNDKNTSTIIRADYTKYYDNLSIYLAFKSEKFRKLSAYLDNLNYANTNLTDQIYFDLNEIF